MIDASVIIIYRDDPVDWPDMSEGWLQRTRLALMIPNAVRVDAVNEACDTRNIEVVPDRLARMGPTGN